jgi:hypothetical protein
VGPRKSIFASYFVGNRPPAFDACWRQASKIALKILANFEVWRYAHFGDASDTPAGAGASV